MSKSKAVGEDCIAIELLQQEEILESVIQWFTKCFNDCIREQHVPDYWPTARVIFINKTSKPIPSITETWMISILPHTFKVFEQIILNRLNEHLQIKGIIHEK